MVDRVYIENYTVCEGIGIFAKDNIKENTIITWYYGEINQNMLENNNYIIDYDTEYGKGLANLLMML